MTITYCLPIVLRKKEDILSRIQQNLTKYSYFEIWLDYIQDLDVDFLKSIETLLDTRVIYVFRRLNLEEPHMSPHTRKEILSNLETSHATIDLDIFSNLLDLEQIKSNNSTVSLITSYHNYGKTPELNELESLIQSMQQFNPTLYKIATYTNSHNDALVLLTLLQSLKQKNKKCIILGMGDYGHVTRIFGTIMGNELVFAPLSKDEQTATGQLTKDEYDTIFNILLTK